MAAQRLGISDRQCRRLLARYREDGPLGMTSRRRGKASNHQLPQGLAAYALNIIRERYNDFGPTLACEKLSEVHGVHLSKETVRKLMTQASLWVPRKQRTPKIQQPRYRLPVPVNSYKSTAVIITGLKTGDLSVRHWFT